MLLRIALTDLSTAVPLDPGRRRKWRGNPRTGGGKMNETLRANGWLLFTARRFFSKSFDPRS
jgi:hypothetical protein